MSNDITDIESRWRAAIESEDTYQITQLVPEILKHHSGTALASELRYNRGVITLTEGEGTGSERLVRALSEFTEGLKSAEQVGANAEPWRTLNHTQIAACLARRNNINGAVEELKRVIAYKPKSPLGLGAYVLLTEVLEKSGRERELNRFRTQRISYARALVRENEGSPEIYNYRFLLAQELLSSTFAKQGQQMLDELLSIDEETLGEDLFGEIRAFIQETQNTSE